MDAAVRCCHGMPAARLVTTMRTDSFRNYLFETRPRRTLACFEHARRPPNHSPSLPACNGGHEVDDDFGSVQVPDVAAVPERVPASLRTSGQSTSYPGEVETRRACLLARRQS